MALVLQELDGRPPSSRCDDGELTSCLALLARLTALVAVFAGFVQHAAASRPRPAGPPSRGSQGAQGDVAVRWLSERTGWR